MFKNWKYSFSKCHNILKWAYKWYKKNYQSLPPEELNKFENRMEKLDHAILSKNKNDADKLARDLEKYGNSKFKRSWFGYCTEFVIAILIALALATVVRQMWFELYKIPTGSMRPTYREQDHLLVSKTSYGLNVPLQTKHFYFNPEAVKRGDVIIWSGDQIDLPGTDTLYFGIFPGKKRYIKRLIGKPGDSLYFYGGKIYGVDQKGNDLVELRDNPAMQNLDHIPFISFEGKQILTKPLKAGVTQQRIFSHFNQPVGRITYSNYEEPYGEVYNGKEWVKDDPSQSNSHSISTYSDVYGMKNFAMARIITKEQLKHFYPGAESELEDAPLYLELYHHPKLSNLDKGFLSVSLIPLDQKHIDKLMGAMYTSRFVIKNHRAAPYSEGGPVFRSNSPTFPGVSDGTYEFYYGKAYEIKLGSYASELPKKNPLYNESAANIQRLFNYGIKFEPELASDMILRQSLPNRYAYFYKGDLYVMGKPIFKKNDPSLVKFLEREKKRANQELSYQPFVDNHPPIRNGKIDADFIRTFGITVPKNHYLVLGDNHANSGDSRFFGFVPAENIRGTPVFIFWPFSSRWGITAQTYSGTIFSIPNITIWSIVFIVLVSWWVYHRIQLSRPIYKKLS